MSKSAINEGNFVEKYNELMRAVAENKDLLDLVKAKGPSHDYLVMPTHLMLCLADEGSYSSTVAELYQSKERFIEDEAWFNARYEIAETGDYPGAQKEYCPCWMVIRDKESGLCYRFDYERPCSYSSSMTMQVDNHTRPDGTPYVMLEAVESRPFISFQWKGKSMKEKPAALWSQNMYVYNNEEMDAMTFVEYNLAYGKFIKEAEGCASMEQLAIKIHGGNTYILVADERGEEPRYDLLIGKEKIEIRPPAPQTMQDLRENHDMVIWLARHEIAKRSDSFAPVREALIVLAEKTMA